MSWTWSGGLNNLVMPAGVTSTTYNYVTEIPIGQYNASGSVNLTNPTEEERLFSTTHKYAKGTLQVYANNVLLGPDNVEESQGTVGIKNKSFYISGLTGEVFFVVRYVPKDKVIGYTKTPNQLMSDNPKLIVRSNSSILALNHFLTIEQRIKTIESKVGDGYVTPMEVYYLTVGSNKLITVDTVKSIIRKLLAIADYLGTAHHILTLNALYSGLTNAFDTRVITTIRNVIDDIANNMDGT